MSVVETVLQQLDRLELSEGDRLPSERRLAEHCAISRSSVRNALKELQSKRVLAVRQGSGYFLASAYALRQALIGRDTQWTMERVVQSFAARSFVTAHVTELVSKDLSAEQLVALEECLVDLGKAVINQHVHAMEQLHQRFMNIILESSPNREFIRMLNEVRIPAHYAATVLQIADDEERNLLFSEHVNLFQAMKKKDHRAAAEICGEVYARLLGLFRKYAHYVPF